MYEHLRNDFIAKLSTDYGREDVQRITAALDSIIKDAEITDIQEMLGHSSVATTQIYAEISKEAVQEAHRKYVV